MEIVYPQWQKDWFEQKFRRIQEEAGKMTKTYDGAKIINDYVKPKQ